MNILRHITAFLLLPLALAPLLLSFVFIVQQQYIWLNMEMALEEEELVTLTLSSEEIIWNKKGRELIINGSLFDVSSFEHDGDGGYTVTGLFDNQEQQLYLKLKSLINSKQQSAGFGSAFQKWFSILYDDVLHVNSIANNFGKALLRVIPVNSLYFPQSYLAIITPPPKSGFNSIKTLS